MTKPCTFCADQLGTTKDHVPPRSFFPKKLPHSTRLITVPCCSACHDRSKETDEALRNILISLKETEDHPDVQRDLASRLNRSFSRGCQNRNRLLGMMREVDVVTSAGLFIRRDWAFDLDNPVFHAFAERLIRALLCYEFGQPFFEGTFGWRFQADLPNEAYAGMARFGCARKVHDVFAYGIVGFGDTDTAWAVANFYGAAEMFIRAQKHPTNSPSVAPSPPPICPG